MAAPNPGSQTLPEDLDEPGLGPVLSKNGRQWGNQHDRDERHQDRCHGDGNEPAIGIKRGTDRRAERKRGKHRHSNPCDDLPGVCGTGKGKPPANSAGDDKALRAAEQCPAAEQDRGG